MRFIRQILHLVTISSLIGCVSTSEIYLADGSVGHEISCDGRELSIETCFEKAAELCGSNGFETVTRAGISTGRSIAKGSTDPNSGPFATRSILVRCKNQRPIPVYE
jgi:hypothetical protein